MMDRRCRLAALATAAVAGLHCVNLFHAGGLWRDEANSMALANLPTLKQVWSLLATDSFPGLFPLTMRLLGPMGWDLSDFYLRIFGFLVGISLLGALWWNARTLGIGSPLLSVSLLGSNLTIIHWGDSLRAYGLGSLLMLITIGLIWRLIGNMSPRRAAAAALAAVLSVQCLYQNTFLLAAICAAASAVCMRRKKKKELFAVLVIALIAAFSLLPYATIVARAQAWWMILKAPLPLRWIWARWCESLDDSTPWMHWVWGGWYGAGMLLALSAMRKPARAKLSGPQKDLCLFAVVALAAGTLGFLIFLKIASLPTANWYYIPLMVFAALCLDVIMALAPKGATTGITLLCCAILGLSFPAVWQGVHRRQTNIDTIAALLEREARPDDLIVVDPWACAVSFNRYYKGAAPWLAVPPLGDRTIHRYDLLKEKMAEPTAIKPVIDRMAKTLSSGNRLWMIGNAFLPASSEFPADLPPPPLPASGWSDWPYSDNWSRQIWHFIFSHAVRVEHLTPMVLAQPIYSLESLPLYVFSGWDPGAASVGRFDAPGAVEIVPRGSLNGELLH